MMPYTLKRCLPFLLLLGLPLLSRGQTAPEVGIFAGTATYYGELQDTRLSFRQAHPAIGLLIRTPIYQRLSLRLGVNFSKLSGADSLSAKQYLRDRNLSFQTSLLDIHLLAEYNIMDFTLAEKTFTPYVFAGIALYHINPYTRDTAGAKYYLQPLSTEGQGLPEYPDRSSYNLTQVAVPFGVGLKVALSPLVNLGIEGSIRPTFSGYLDDVSGTYADEATLLKERGQKAVDLAFRTRELPGHEADPYPPEGTRRGSGYNDWYYFVGVTLTFNLGEGSGLGGRFGNALRQLRCPPAGNR